MRTRIVFAVSAGLLACNAALADRVAGLAGIAPAKAVPAQSAAVAPALLSGVVSGVRPDGSQVEIDGKWYVLKQGRSLLLHNGLPVDASVLAKGQKLKYSLASATPGEMALGVVHVP